MGINKFLSSQKTFWVFLLICHASVLIILHFNFGFNTLNEGAKYLSKATDLAKGSFYSSTHYPVFYIAYVLYLSIFIFLKIPAIFIFLSTYLLSLFSYYKFHQLIAVYSNKETAKLWLLFICISPLIQYWQFNLFSETFFIAVSLLFSYVCLFPKIKYRLLKIICLVLIVTFSRPSGIFTVICIGLFTLYKNNVLPKKTTFLLGTFILISLFTGIVFFFKLPYHDFSKYISNGSVYYGFPGWSSPELPKGDYTLYNCYEFIYQHKGLKTVLILFLEKINSFFLTTRAYYSDFHNLINKSHNLFYVFAVLSMIISNKKDPKLYAFLLVFLIIILLNALMVGLIFNEWSERHTLQVFPYMILLASYSIIHFLRILKTKLVKS